MHPIEEKLIKVLINYETPVSSDVIAKQIEVSTRTVKRYIKSVSESGHLLGGYIVSDKNGYLLKINQADKVSLINSLNMNKKIENVDISILCYLFTHEYSSISQISDEIYCNRNTVNKKLNDSKLFLKEYNLDMLSKSKYGFYIVGSELDIRRCFVDIFDENDIYVEHCLDKLTDYKIEKNYILKCITDEFRKGRVIKSVEEIRLIEKYILVSMMREKLRSIDSYMNDISVNVGIIQSLENIVDKINKKIGFLLNSSIKYYLASILDGHLVTYDECEVIKAIYFDTLRALEEKYNERFLNNEVFVDSLFKHLKAACQRLKMNIQLDNPLKDSIKSKYYMSFEYATELVKRINKTLNYHFSDNEIAYLALHFEISNEAKKDTNKRKIIIVCNNGIGTSVLLKTKITNQLPMLDIVDILPFYMLDTYPLKQIDFIITTHPFENTTGKKVIVVNSILTDKDVQNILNYINMSINLKELFKPQNFHIIDFDNKDQVMEHITNHLLTSGMITKEIADIVTKREIDYPTEIGHMTVIPHCIVEIRSFIYVLILKKTIQWKNEKIKIIFFCGINTKEEGSKGIFRYINKKVSDAAQLKELCESRDYNEFIKKILS